MRRTLLAILVAASVGCASDDSPAAGGALPAGVAATIDGVPLPSSALADEVQRMAGDLRKLPPQRGRELTKQTLDRMIDDRLCTKALAASGAAVTDAELDAELARRGALAGAPGVSPAVVRQALRSLLCRKRLVEKRGHLEVSEADVAAALRTLPEAATEQQRERLNATLRGQRWRDEEQRIFVELRAHAKIRVSPTLK